MDKSPLKPETVEELLKEKRFSKLRFLLKQEQPADLGALFGDIRKTDCPVLFRLLPKESAAAVFSEMEAQDQKLLIDGFSDRELSEVLEELYLDDTVDLIEEMPASAVNRILQNSAPEARRELNELLRYPADSAGSMMTTEYVRLRPEMTVEEAFSLIRRVAIDKETVYTCYVTDRTRMLIGVISVKTLLLADRTETIGSRMNRNVISVQTLTDTKIACSVLGKYGLLSLPVVDTEGRMVGIITVDDAMDAIHEETEEDFAKMAAITPQETAYLHTSARNIFLSRIPWLLLLMISATLTGMIISAFESSLSACVYLTAFIPMLMDTGGNSGNQASVTVIRALSLGEIGFRDLFRVIKKEITVAFLCAVVLGIASFSKIYLIDFLLLGSLSIAEMPTVPLVVALTLFFTVLCAKLIGAFLPIVSKRFGLDPAVTASPFITTAVDTISLALYFQIARMLIPGL